MDSKVKDIRAKQDELKAAQETTSQLQDKIAAQQRENQELESTSKALCGEKIAFERYYEQKKKSRKFASVRKFFEKDKPLDYKPWLDYLPSAGTVERSMLANMPCVQLPPTSLPPSAQGNQTASARSRSML